MLKIYRDPVTRIAGIINAWASVMPEKSFFGLTLDQFRAAVKPTADTRAEVAECRKRLEGALARQRDADAAAKKLVQNVVRSVQADPEAGENSPLYAAMGYVRTSERASGLKRPRPAVTAPLDVKTEGQAS